MNKGRLKKKDEISYNSSSSTGFSSSAGQFDHQYEHGTGGCYDQDSQYGYYTQQPYGGRPRGGYDYFHCESDCGEHDHDHENDVGEQTETAEVYIPNYSGFPATATEHNGIMPNLKEATSSNTDSQSSCCKKVGQITGGMTCCVTIDQLKAQTAEAQREPDKQKDKDQFVLSSFFKSKFPEYLPLGFDFMSSNEFSSTFRCKCVGCPCKSTLGANTICMGNLLRMEKQIWPAETACSKRQPNISDAPPAERNLSN